MENDENKNLFEYYKTLIELRRTDSAFHTPNLVFFHEDADNEVLAFQRFDDNGNIAAVVINFSDNNLENYTVNNFPEGEKLARMDERLRHEN